MAGITGSKNIFGFHSWEQSDDTSQTQFYAMPLIQKENNLPNR